MSEPTISEPAHLAVCSTALLGALRQIVEDAQDVSEIAERSQCNDAGRMVEKCAFIVSNAEEALSLIAHNDELCGGASPSAPAAGSPIPAIESAVLNIGTAANDCAHARDEWMDEKWNDATMWISNAIAQLDSARAKIYAHQEVLSGNDALCDGGPQSVESK